MSKNKDNGKVEIKLIKSFIGRTARQEAVARSLGLRKIHQKRIIEKKPELMGMVKKIDFMLEVSEVSND